MVSLKRKTAAERVEELTAEQAALSAALADLEAERTAAHDALRLAYVAAERGTGTETDVTKAEKAAEKIDHAINRKRAAVTVVEQELEQAQADAITEARQAKLDRIEELRKETAAIADQLEKNGLDSDPRAWQKLAANWKEAEGLHAATADRYHPGASPPVWRKPETALALRLETIAFRSVGYRLITLAGQPPTLGNPPKEYDSLKDAFLL